MSNQDYRQPSSQSSSSGATNYGNDMLAKASELAGDAAGKVKQGASDTVASISGEVKHLLDQQVHTGAHMVEKLASTAKRAAQDLDRESPHLAGMVRAFADRMEGYAHNLDEVTVEDLVKNASDYTRRQPALMFGLAALAGFFVMRTIKITQSTPTTSRTTVSSPSIQPSHPVQRHTAGSFHGA